MLVSIWISAYFEEIVLFWPDVFRDISSIIIPMCRYLSSLSSQQYFVEIQMSVNDVLWNIQIANGNRIPWNP